MDQKIVKKIWDKSSEIAGKDKDLYREDCFGNVMYFHSYGKDTAMGWKITQKDGRRGIEEQNLHAISTDDEKIKKQKIQEKKKSEEKLPEKKNTSEKKKSEEKPKVIKK